MNHDSDMFIHEHCTLSLKIPFTLVGLFTTRALWKVYSRQGRSGRFIHNKGALEGLFATRALWKVYSRQGRSGRLIHVQARCISKKLISCMVNKVAATPLPLHRRRIKTEEKAKVFASVWGEDFIQCRASYFVKDDFEE